MVRVVVILLCALVGQAVIAEESLKYCFENYGYNFGADYSHEVDHGKRSINYDELLRQGRLLRRSFSGMGVCIKAPKAFGLEQEAYDSISENNKGYPAYLQLSSESFGLLSHGVRLVSEQGNACQRQANLSKARVENRIAMTENGPSSESIYFVSHKSWRHTEEYIVKEERQGRGLVVRLKQQEHYPFYMNCYFPLKSSH